MKKWIAAVLAVLMTLTLIGCSCTGKTGGKHKTDSKQSTPLPEPTAEPTPEPTPEPTAEPTPEPTYIPAADPQALVGTWKTAQVAAGSYVLSADEIKSYGFDLVVNLNEDGTGAVTSPSSPRFQEEIVFNGSAVTYMDADIPFLYVDDVITLDYSMNGIVFTVTLERAPEPSAPDPVEAPEALVNAFRKTQDAQSMHVDLTIDVVIHLGVALLSVNEEIDIRGDFALDQQKDPCVDRIEGTMSTAGTIQNFLVYSEIVDDTFRTYSSEDGGKTWQQSSGSTSALISPSSVLDQWASYQKTAVQSGTESVDGRETVVYTGTLSAEFLTQSGGVLLNKFEGFDTEDLLKDLDDIAFTVNVDSETGYISRSRLDLTAAIETLMGRIMDRQLGTYAQFVTVECTVSSGLIEYTVSQINEVPEIELPAEVRMQRSVEPTEPAEPAQPEEPAEEDGIVGEWALYGGADRNSQEYVDFMLALGIDMTIIFNADGTGGLYITIDGESEISPFTYTLKDDKLIINGTATPVSIDGDFLTLNVEGHGNVLFKRK